MNLRSTPWLTEGSINFLEKFLKKTKNAKILEFGMGSSTVWLLNRCSYLVSIEHNKEWFNAIKEKISQNKSLTMILRESKQIGDTDLLEISYADEAQKFSNNFFDVVLIDGRNRVECFIESEPKLKEGGLMMLDNSERIEYKQIHEAYKEKPSVHFIQNRPDIEGFYQPGWITTCWIK